MADSHATTAFSPLACPWLPSSNYRKHTTVEGSGPKPRKGQTVFVHCTGIVEASGKKFWSTKDPGQKVFSFNIGQGSVIPAWDEGCLTMSVGESARITATHEVAYGAAGFPAWGIPGHATLLFDIEMLEVR